MSDEWALVERKGCVEDATDVLKTCILVRLLTNLLVAGISLLNQSYLFFDWRWCDKHNCQQRMSAELFKFRHHVRTPDS